MANPQFWNGKRVLLTGHTGFKGSWLGLWLADMGAEVSGLSLEPDTDPSLFRLLNGGQDVEPCDIRDRTAVSARVLASRPEIVLHLAAQPLVRAGYRDPLATYETNVQGTANLLDALRIAPDLRAVVVVTTDKVYENPETGRPFVETDPLGGHDPYSASKAAAEIVTASYRSSFFAARRVGLATARAGNVIGGGDWAEDRLIPDAVRAWGSGQVLDVRRPGAVRPWQHVLEPLNGYLMMAERLWTEPDFASSLNFGPDSHSAATVGDVLQRARSTFGQGDVLLGDGSAGPHEAGYLMLDSARATATLGYRPCWSLDETVKRTMAWYRAQASGVPARQLCLGDIADYRQGLATDLREAV
ncbi:CDP-glucose 4,6-dehydratase [Agrobacterium sp. a22-2]|uniref:CDP-glucose 4,6-dehydratase n=1 Tax=Agrobacterium sp. a22-2 TaxID=2283840 RepID=UPI001445CE83|nr:CDP-glucose 4,6-dehydratase [Agrobacterium sp. a22-2]NKN34910.1 CDP-glucose 4,6-dehydratase [Agrobacterium sp. a22-2]